jgi:hypothetical protein
MGTGLPRRAMLPRRAVLLAGAGVVVAGGVIGGYELVQDGVLPGKYRLAGLLGECGSPPAAPKGPLPSRHEVTFWSRYRKRTVHMVTLVPAGLRTARGLRTVIGLHGLGGDAVSMAGQLGPAMTAARITEFAAVTVDGGDTYWHERADGDDPVGMILFEVLPRAAGYGLVTGPIGIIGESMGGYGALLLAERLGAAAGHDGPGLDGAGPDAAGHDVAGLDTAGHVALPTAAAVAALSPAIFASYADARAANPGAFDSRADFARNDVQSQVAGLRHVPAWITSGSEDPFQAQAQLLRARLARLTGQEPAGGVLPGCHDTAFFERGMPAALTFLGGHLPVRNN